jgi:hypothetical protein
MQQGLESISPGSRAGVESSKTGQGVGHRAQVNKNLSLFLCLLIRNYVLYGLISYF